MKLKEFLINKNVGDMLVRYGRDNNLSPSLIIENLIEEFLYNKGYLDIGLDDDGEYDVSPADIYAERKSKFVSNSKGLLKYGDLDFGYYDKDEIDEVIDKLLDFSDDELMELDRNKWAYSKQKYKKFIREKMDNPLLTVEEFLKDKCFCISKVERKYKTRVVTEFYYKNNAIAHFNHNNYSKKQIQEVEMFLQNLGGDELDYIVENRKESDLQSSEYLLQYMGKHNQKTDIEKLPYTVIIPSGNVVLQRKGLRFGTHKPDKVKNVWDFLEDKRWSKSYSTSGVGVTGKEYLQWLYSEMAKEGAL